MSLITRLILRDLIHILSQASCYTFKTYCVTSCNFVDIINNNKDVENLNAFYQIGNGTKACIGTNRLGCQRFTEDIYYPLFLSNILGL